MNYTSIFRAGFSYPSGEVSNWSGDQVLETVPPQCRMARYSARPRGVAFYAIGGHSEALYQRHAAG